MNTLYIVSQDYLTNTKPNTYKFKMYLSNQYYTNKLTKLYINNNNKINKFSWENIYNQYLLVFSKNIETLNLIKISISITNNKTIIKRGSINNSLLSFWVFKDYKYPLLYPISIIIWPPAYKFKNKIVSILNNKYTINESYDVIIPKSYLNRFVYNLYIDDVRCDKSKLGNKINFFKSFPNKCYFIKLLVKDLKLNNNNISKISLYIKNTIRTLFKKKIDGYIYDVIIHISDNKKHAKSIEYFSKNNKNNIKNNNNNL